MPQSLLKEGRLDIKSIAREVFFRGPVEVVCQPRIIRPLCAAAFYKHSKGCPNLGIKAGCPPRASLFTGVFEPEVYVVAVKFDLAEYVAKKRLEHSNWTQRALENPRHWQGHVRSILREACETRCRVYPDYVSVTNAEAMGVNLTDTLRNVGIILEWPPRKAVYQVSLLAKPKKCPQNG